MVVAEDSTVLVEVVVAAAVAAALMGVPILPEVRSSMPTDAAPSPSEGRPSSLHARPVVHNLGLLCLSDGLLQSYSGCLPRTWRALQVQGRHPEIPRALKSGVFLTS